MKTILLFLLVLLPVSPANAATLGIPDGIYDGGGSLKPLNKLEPQLTFTSHRIIKNGTVEAYSSAYLLGIKIISIAARLQLVPDQIENEYKVLDLDHNRKQVGEAFCHDGSCNFTARVSVDDKVSGPKGEFYLIETWTPIDHGFRLSEGNQIYKGTPADYIGEFYSQDASYEQVRDLVFEAPLKSPPKWEGIDPKQVMNAFFLRTGEIVDRSHATFESESNFRPARPKLLHPVGICAEAEWHITTSSKATGLFRKGTRVPALIRFSAGTSDSVYLPKGPGRIFGLAVKLFPTHNESEPVETVNIQMLDHYGFDRTKRKRYFFEDSESGDTPVFFTNVAPAESAFGKALATFFDRFDKPNFSRPVYPLAQIDEHGNKVESEVSPYEIRLIPNFKPNTIDPEHENIDFRTELSELKPGSVKMDIVIQSYEPKNETENLEMVNEKIGTLEIGKMVLSNTCDLNLHFNHPFNRFKKVLH